MTHVSWLVRLAVLVWVAWLMLVGLMLGLLRLRVWHPHFLPVTTVFALLVAAGVAFLVVGVWRLIRGPRRVFALSVLLLGLAPLGFFAGHMMYGFSLAFSTQLELNLPLQALIPVGDSILDLIARFSYPQRTASERVEMIASPLPEATARQQVAMMDRHISELESRLGRTGQRRVYWVRGPLWGLQGRAIDSLCFGSRADEPAADPASLTKLDRHEVAHVVLSQFCTLDVQPPALLVEGWAEANSGIAPNALLLRAWSEWEMGRTYSLRELLGPEWYGRHEGAVYVQGALLVNYILRAFGPDRFVSLYTTCRQATFDEDCRRILVVTVDQLDRDYWADIEKASGPTGTRGSGCRRYRWVPALTGSTGTGSSRTTSTQSNACWPRTSTFGGPPTGQIRARNPTGSLRSTVDAKNIRGPARSVCSEWYLAISRSSFWRTQNTRFRPYGRSRGMNGKSAKNRGSHPQSYTGGSSGRST
jgi:hypothetical protein